LSLEQFAAAYAAGKAAEVVQPPDADMTAAEIGALLKKGRKSLQAGKNFVARWSRRDSILRPGEKALRPCQDDDIPRVGQIGPPPKRWRREDVLAILAGEEHTRFRPGRDPGTHTNRQAKQLIRQALLENGPMRTEEFARFARGNRIILRQRRWCEKKLHLRREQCGGNRDQTSYVCLPSQKPPRLDHAPAVSLAKEFLEEYLADCQWHPVQELFRAAKERGIHHGKVCLAFPYAGRPHGRVVKRRAERGKVRYGDWRLTATAPASATRVTEPAPAAAHNGHANGSILGQTLPRPLGDEADRDEPPEPDRQGPAPGVSLEQCDILDKLYDLGAFSRRRSVRSADLAEKLGLSDGTVRRRGACLKDKGLVDSGRGQVGGYWLTSDGKAYIEAARRGEVEVDC
jgi:hypothetical protein